MDFEDNFYQFKILSRYSTEPYGFKKISNPQPGALAQYLIAKAQANPAFEQSLHAFCPKTEELINPYDTELEVAYLKELTFRLMACTLWYRKSDASFSSLTDSFFDNRPTRTTSFFEEDRFTPPWATSSGLYGGSNSAYSANESEFAHLEPSVRAHMETMRRISNARPANSSTASTGGNQGSSSSNTAINWLEINLYYADQHQTPVFEHPYALTLADGSVRKGTVNQRGYARIEGIPEGKVTVELAGDPAQQDTLRRLHDRLEGTLNKLVKQAAEDAKHQAIGNAHLNALEKKRVYVGAIYMAGVDIVTDLWAFAKLVGQGLVKAELAYLDLLEDFFRGDVRAIQRKLEQAKANGIGTYKAASEASEAIYLLVSDPHTWEILTNFVEDYWEASSGVDLTRNIAPIVLEILITLLTAGAGAPVFAAKLGNAAQLTDEAVDITKQIVAAHKAAGHKTVKSARTNQPVLIPIKKPVPQKIPAAPDWTKIKTSPQKGKLNFNKKKPDKPKSPIDPALQTQLDNIEGLSEKQKQQIIQASQKGKTFEGDFQSGSKGNWNKDLNKDLKPNALYRVNGYLYETDDVGRIIKVSGKLTLEKADRNKYQQSKAGKTGGIKDGLTDDEGGHLIASLFKGPGEQINYAAMDGNFNKGAWKRLENKWAKALKAKPPKEVEVEIIPIYDANSKRPTKFNVLYTIDGKQKWTSLDNKPL